METSVWINIITAILLLGAIIVSLVIGLKSIHQTKNIQKGQSRHALLKEIVEWATDVGDWRSEYKNAVKDMLVIKDKREQQLFLYAHIAEIKEGLMGMMGRNQYISEVARIFDQTLQEAVEMLRGELEAYISFLDEWRHAMAYAVDKGVDDKQENTQKAKQYEQKLDQYVNAVMKECANVVTSDIC
jgi:hypothetical protein